MRRLALLPLSILLACSGSGDDGTTTGRDAGFADAGEREDVITPLAVTLDVVDGLNTDALIGDSAVMRQQADGTYLIVYGAVPAGETKQEVRMATSGASWTTEFVARPAEAIQMATGTLVGLGFDLVNDVPHVVYLGGDNDGNMVTPYPTDLELAVRNGATWSTQVLVNGSGESNGMCTSLDNICNFGHVVGSHAAIDANAAGYSVVYRDIHGGFESDGPGLADVELYKSVGGASLVDGERSGGEFADIGHLADGRVVLAYHLPKPVPGQNREGMWAAVEQIDGTWVRTRIDSSGTSSKVSIAVAADNTIYVAYYQLSAGDLVLATSTDQMTWTTEVVDASGRTGLHPNMALDSSDQPVIAYGYCGKTSDRDCPESLGNDSQVRLARRVGGAWKLFSVDDGQGFGYVGLFNAVIVDRNDKVAIAYQDTFNNDLLFAKEE